MRQRQLLGAPVAETRLRIPGGDAVQRVWTVADGGGCTLVEVTNDSPLPIACAFTRRDVLTNRPPAAVPIEGIDLPAATTIVMPIAHRTSVTIGLAHDGRGAGALPAGLPSAEATARGWVALAERASRLVLPDEGEVERVVAARCELLLAGPPDAAVDPVGYLLGVGELVRMGEVDDPAALVPDVAAAVEAVARSDGRDVAAALDAAGMVLARAGESRALINFFFFLSFFELVRSSTSTACPDVAAAVEPSPARRPGRRRRPRRRRRDPRPGRRTPCPP